MNDINSNSVRKIHLPCATVILAFLNIAIMAVLLYRFNTIEPTPQSLVDVGGNIRSLTLRGQYWRLISSAFLHADIEHILLNTVSLFYIGIALEKFIGGINIFCVYLITAVSGGLLSLAYHDNIVCVGASGAIYGLFGASVTYILSVYRRNGFEIAEVFSFMKSSLVCLVANLAYSLQPGIDMAGHIGGLLGGLLLGFIIGIPINGAFVGSVIVGAILLFSWFEGADALKMTEKELSVEIGNFMKEKVEESLEQSLGKEVDVNIQDIIIVHDEGDKYRGFVKLECKYGGTKEVLIRSLRVEYDGTQYSYEFLE